MNKSNHSALRIFNFFILSIFLVFFLAAPGWTKQEGIKKILVLENPLTVKLLLTRNVPVKVIQIEKKELLIALKNVKLEKGFKIEGKNKAAIKHIAIENLQGNVIAVILTGHKDYTVVSSGFNKADTSFTIQLEKKSDKSAVSRRQAEQPVPKKQAVPVKKTPPETRPAPAEKKRVSPDENVPKTGKTTADLPARNETSAKSAKAAALPPAVYVPPEREQSKFNGDIRDLVLAVEEAGCDAKFVRDSLVLFKKALNKEAFEILDAGISQENPACLEPAYFLKAYAFYQQAEKDDFAHLLKAERMFQDALVLYPKSAYVPYGYAAMGLIQKRMNNASAAEGYFNIVKQGWLEYPGMPEILYHLADIYNQKGYLDKALTYYKQVFEDTRQNSHIPDAGIGYGKALFNKHQYLDALSVLNYVVQADPKKVFITSELLLLIGNANFEVGDSQAARQTLTRVMNLFPEMESRDMILTKIGDTYGMEDQYEKATKVYELVREKFPDTEGFIASSIGIARYLKKDAEKIAIYEMIKAKYPENSFARIAMMRLAEIYQANGEYDKCIKEIEDLLSTHPRGLRYEAVKLMQKAYEALFQKQLKDDEFTQLLNRYELEHTRIDRMGSRQIALSVGLAYLRARLYEEAFNHLINAYKQYNRSSRSSDLLFGLGVAMDESGRDEDALKLFNAFADRFAKSKDRVESLTRAGNIYLEKKNYKLSSKKYTEAFRVSKNHLQKGNILSLHAGVYEQEGNMKTASELREIAVKEIALASGDNYDRLSDAYKELGRTYVLLEKYINAADSYLKALSLSKTDQEKANLGFLLGDAYQKGNILPKAKEAFKQVVSSYDSVWARLAQQRLDTLALAETVQNS